MIDRFLYWWLLIILVIIGAAVTWNFGFFHFLQEKDFTRLGLINLLIFSVCSVSVGTKIYRDSKDYETEWFCSDAVVTIGMIGTVIGFIYMLFSVFSNIDLGDSAKTMKALSEMANGMSTAMLTTLVGLVTSVLLKFQLVISQK